MAAATPSSTADGGDEWAAAPASRTTRDAGQPGVRLRFYLDMRQPFDA
ncbi:DUF6207 family protein [Streptomyces sp. NPDC056930]